MSKDRTYVFHHDATSNILHFLLGCLEHRHSIPPLLVVGKVSNSLRLSVPLSVSSIIRFALAPTVLPVLWPTGHSMQLRT